MDLIVNNLQIPIEKDGSDEYIRAASQELGAGEGDIVIKKILSKSLDMRDRAQFYYKVSLVVRIADVFKNSQDFPLYTEEITTKKKTAKIKDRPIIVGFGPAGMFAALELIDNGIKPIIFERGKKIEERSLDVQRFT